MPKNRLVTYRDSLHIPLEGWLYKRTMQTALALSSEHDSSERNKTAKVSITVMALQLLSTVLALTLVFCLTEAQEQSSNESLPLTPAFANLRIARGPDDSDSCAVPETQPLISNFLQQVLEDEVINRFPCNSQLMGLTANCPANNCSELFDLVQDGIAHFSNYYWLQAPNGEVHEVYCNIVTRDATSCSQINELGLPSGEYTIRSSGDSPVTVYCDMDRVECGGGVWTRVASYDYSDLNTSCPGDWTQITSPVRGCQRNTNYQQSCESAVFPTGLPYSRVCGRVLAIQYGYTPAFVHADSTTTLDDIYVNGVSITYGNPRAHIWTFAAYPSGNDNDLIYDGHLMELCPCSQPSLSIPPPPSFIGNNYFCDTAISDYNNPQYYPEDPLFDGQGCEGESTCCSFNNPPWFSTSLPQTTSEDIEVRECGVDGANTLITNIDLYIN